MIPSRKTFEFPRIITSATICLDNIPFLDNNLFAVVLRGAQLGVMYENNDASNQNEKRAVSMYSYFRKMKGSEKSPKMVSLNEVWWSFIGSFIGIAALNYIHFDFVAAMDLNLIIGSFGASAVLVFGAIGGPLSQPRNLVGGHIISAIVGVFFYQLFPQQLWFAGALAVSSAIAAMHLTKTLHPPGGATALIAVIGSPKLHSIGYLYAIFPVARGALILLIIALLVNNISSTRQYPKYWW